jgi:DNA-binding response OmpR family regulator
VKQPDRRDAPLRRRAGGTTVLVVDDDSEYRAMFRHLFEPPYYRVVEAPDGVSGLCLAQTEQPDCIILDLLMPGLNGFDVLERLQQDSRTRDIPVIILTGADYDARKVDRGLSGGAVDYVMKPVDIHDIAARVQAAIRRRGS